MGFEDLVLVAPRYRNVLRLKETIERASGARSVLVRARIVETLDEALDGMTHLCATAMIGRDFGPPTRTPREHFEWLAQSEKTIPARPQAAVGNVAMLSGLEPQRQPELQPQPQPQQGGGTAFLFGTERYGMRNEDVYRCHVALQIPSNPCFGSLNLAAAVQVIAYEWRLYLQSQGMGYCSAQAVMQQPCVPEAHSPDAAHVPKPETAAARAADAAMLSGMLEHWQQALEHIGFLDPQSPKKLMPTLNQLFNRAHLTERDIHILRGIAKAMMQERRYPKP